MADDDSSLHYFPNPNRNPPPDIRRVTNLSEFVSSSNAFEFGHTRPTSFDGYDLTASKLHHHHQPFNIEGYQDLIGFPTAHGGQEMLTNARRRNEGLSLSLASNNPRRELIRTTTSCSGNGPLGPFTGYATILKNSRYLRPAQNLMEQWCGTTTVMSSATFHSSNEVLANFVADCNGGGCTSSSRGVTNYHEMKARLSYLLEEVCKRYKVYNQQIQMVVSSFETVAGLGSSTPYVSLAFKSMSRKFKSMKQVILDQLRHVTKVLGDELVGRQIVGSSNLDFLHEAHQHVYRSQRGLPEGAVAVLRGWLFDHFLHPYPTDVDKHLLATQTGLTRNQVSNWFINARVRIWKPMVEEIHKLESHNLVDQPGPSNSTVEHNCHGFGPSTSSIGHEQAGQHQGKRSRVEFIQFPMNNGSTIGNSVSLTLGLRHGFAENVSQHQHQRLQEHEDRLMREFGGGYGGMVHDFGG